MSLCFSLWMRVGSLSLVLAAVGSMERCTEQESLLQEIPSSIVEPTQCLMDCTALTFIKKQELGDHRNMRFTDSTEEEHRNLKEYCWPLELKCTVGESLQRAFVVVPVDPSVVAHEHLAVRSTEPGVSGALRAHGGPIALADDCGVRYEVTPVYQSAAPESPGGKSLFCVQVARRQPLLSGDGMMKCPPFLVTVWQPSADQPQREPRGLRG